MRKWSNLLKASISERIGKEEEDAFRKEFNEKNPSQAPFTETLNEE
jgi:hypothetical protein